MFFVECKPDFLFVKKIFKLSRKEIRHGKNKPGVLALLEKTTNNIGIIDEDPDSTQPKLLSDFVLVKETNFNFNFMKNYEKENYLIIIKPFFEEWILRVAQESNIEMKKFKLPDTAKDLHQIINTKLNNLDLLLDELIKNNTHYFSEMTKLIRELDN